MKILLPFFDDSTLLFAFCMSEKLTHLGFSTDIIEDCNSESYSRVSDRQYNSITYGAERKEISSLFANDSIHPLLCEYVAVICSRVPIEIRTLLESDYKEQKNRPKFICFYPGLEFTPLKGFKNRNMFDAIYFNCEEHKILYEAQYPERCREQYLSYGHPYLLKPKTLKPLDGGAIYFFAQALSPATYNSRKHIVEILIAIANKNPTRKVILKLRHLPSENKDHVHKEKYDYVSLLPKTLPSNVELTAENMSSCLKKASIAITCTSTAAMDAISAGIPVMIYLDYVEYYSDQLRAPMEDLFSESGLITSLNELLHLEVPKISQSWLDLHFRGEEFFDDIGAYLKS